jgi:hypothetical protein
MLKKKVIIKLKKWLVLNQKVIAILQATSHIQDRWQTVEENVTRMKKWE